MDDCEQRLAALFERFMDMNNPYEVKPQGPNSYRVVNTETGETYSSHTDSEAAKREAETRNRKEKK